MTSLGLKQGHESVNVRPVHLVTSVTGATGEIIPTEMWSLQGSGSVAVVSLGP